MDEKRVLQAIYDVKKVWRKKVTSDKILSMMHKSGARNIFINDLEVLLNNMEKQNTIKKENNSYKIVTIGDTQNTTQTKETYEKKTPSKLQSPNTSKLQSPDTSKLQSPNTSGLFDLFTTDTPIENNNLAPHNRTKNTPHEDSNRLANLIEAKVSVLKSHFEEEIFDMRNEMRLLKVAVERSKENTLYRKDIEPGYEHNLFIKLLQDENQFLKMN